MEERVSLALAPKGESIMAGEARQQGQEAESSHLEPQAESELKVCEAFST